MEILKIKATDETPSIILDKVQGVFEFSGRSLPEHAPNFYEPIIKWIEDYTKQPLPETNFVFKLEYFNTASSKYLLEILFRLENIEGKKMVTWCFLEDDEDMAEAGEEFSEMLENISFELSPLATF